MKLLLCALVSVVALASIGLASSLKSPASGSVPVEISVVGGTVGAGNTVTYRVTMDGSSNRGQLVAISATSGAYSALPTIVVVPAYSSTVEFNATISADPPGSWSIYATANQVAVQAHHMIVSSK